MPEAEGVEEVVQGEIRKTPPNKIIHADVVENLSDLLKAQLDRKTVQVRVSTFGLVIRRDPVTTRVPDIAVFIRQNVVEQDGYIHSVPELVALLREGQLRPSQFPEAAIEIASIWPAAS